MKLKMYLVLRWMVIFWLQYWLKTTQFLGPTVVPYSFFSQLTLGVLVYLSIKIKTLQKYPFPTLHSGIPDADGRRRRRKTNGEDERRILSQMLSRSALSHDVSDHFRQDGHGPNQDRKVFMQYVQSCNKDSSKIVGWGSVNNLLWILDVEATFGMIKTTTIYNC